MSQQATNRLIDKARIFIRHYWSVYKTDQILRMYTKGKYDKIAKNLNTFKAYKYININEYPFIFFVISEQNKDCINTFLSKIKYKDSVLNDFQNSSNLTPSSFALLNGLYDIADVLKANGANIFMASNDQNTIVHQASFYGKLSTLEYALKSGCDVNQKNINGDTALHLAVAKQNKDIVKFLLKQPNINQLISNNNEYLPLHEAVQSGNVEIMEMLISKLSEIRNMQKKFDVIHLASQQESKDMLSYLLKDKKHLVNLIDNKNTEATPLHYAAMAKSIECARYLLENGARINAQDKMGNTPLHVAVLNKDLEMIKTLVEFNADASIVNKDSMNTIDLCYSDRDISLINFFRSQTQYIKLFRMTKK